MKERELLLEALEVLTHVTEGSPCKESLLMLLSTRFKIEDWSKEMTDSSLAIEKIEERLERLESVAFGSSAGVLDENRRLKARIAELERIAVADKLARDSAKAHLAAVIELESGGGFSSRARLLNVVSEVHAKLSGVM